MARKFKNNARSLVAGSGLTATATTLTVTTGDGDKFPAVSSPDFFSLTLQNSTGLEIVKVTARPVGSDSMTIVRAQEGTIASVWAAGDLVSMRLTAAALEEFSTGDASAMVVTPGGNLSSANVQDALLELQADIDTRAAAAVLAAHMVDPSAHPEISIPAAAEPDGEYRGTLVYTGAAIYTKPVGLKRIRVTVVGGGGGKGTYGPFSSNGGGGGGTSIKTIEAAALGATESIQVGSGGTAGNSGGTSSFGAHCSATGGSSTSGQGNGYNGDINIMGISGSYLYTISGYSFNGDAGFSFFGYGYGRGGSVVSGYTSGTAGVVIIEEFF